MGAMKLEVKLQQLTPTTAAFDQTLGYSCPSHLYLDSEQPDCTVVRSGVPHRFTESEFVPYAKGEAHVNIPWLCDRFQMIHGHGWDCPFT